MSHWVASEPDMSSDVGTLLSLVVDKHTRDI